MTLPRRGFVLSDEANNDLSNVVLWTFEKFGERQAISYSEAISDAFAEIADDPFCVRSKKRDEIGSGHRTLHIAKPGRHNSHLLLYDVDAQTVKVLRILHDSMEISRHLFEE